VRHSEGGELAHDGFVDLIEGLARLIEVIERDELTE